MGFSRLDTTVLSHDIGSRREWYRLPRPCALLGSGSGGRSLEAGPFDGVQNSATRYSRDLGEYDEGSVKGLVRIEVVATDFASVIMEERWLAASPEISHADQS